MKLRAPSSTGSISGVESPPLHGRHSGSAHCLLHPAAQHTKINHAHSRIYLDTCAGNVICQSRLKLEYCQSTGNCKSSHNSLAGRSTSSLLARVRAGGRHDVTSIPTQYTALIVWSGVSKTTRMHIISRHSRIFAYDRIMSVC